MIFSFLVFFFPVSLVYAGEIRMYSLAMLLVTLTAVYAYRIYRTSLRYFLRRADAHCAPLQSGQFLRGPRQTQGLPLQNINNCNKFVSVKNWIIFAICSLAGAYTHYYALMASGLINLFLLIGLVVNCIKNGEQRAQWCHL